MISRQAGPLRMSRHRSRGAALLVLLVVTVLGSVAFILSDMNARLSADAIEDTSQTRRALKEARDALLGAAMAVVDDAGAIEVRPGQLPWPDRATDGTYDGLSDCIAVQAGNLIGRFPYNGSAACLHNATVALNAYVEDGSGEPLWYAVSRNVLYYNAAADGVSADLLFNGHLKINPQLLDVSPYPWMRVCDADGNLLAANVAAVIIAPGRALANQDRSGAAPAAAQFLDSITINGAVISNADSDEAADAPALCGGAVANAGEDFVAAVGLSRAQRVSFNDQLIYITADELLGAVQARAMNAVKSGLEVHVQAHGVMPWLSPFANAAAGAPAGSPLISATVAVPGSTTFTANAPAAGDLDSLQEAGGLVGAAIRNMTDGSTAQVVSVAGNAVTTTELVGGVDNAWQAGDTYQLPSFRGDPGTRFGQVPFHDPAVAEDRRADFSVLWELQAGNVSGVVVTPVADARAEYTATATAAALSTSLSGPVTVGSGAFDPPAGALSGVCRQVGQLSAASELAAGEGYARCQGRAATRAGYLRMNAASASATVLQASNVAETSAVAFDFAAWGIRPGDRVTNLSDGSRGIVTALAVGGDSARLRVTPLTGGAADVFSVNDEVTVQAAARGWGSQSTGGSSTTLEDTTVNFQTRGVAVDDIVVNLDDGSYAFVTGVAANQLTLSGLQGGAANSFGIADDYELRSAFVSSRRITFDLLFYGPRSPGPLVNENVYTVRSTAQPVGSQEGIRIPLADATVNESYQDAAIHLQDFDAGGNLVAEVKVRIGASDSGYLEVRNIEEDFVLSSGDAAADVVNGADLPRWLYEQGWHEYVAVGLGLQYQPDGNGACVNAGDCLTVSVFDARSVQANNTQVPAVVLGAGAHTGAAGVPARPTPDITAYFEGVNADANDDTFEQGRFNPNVAVTSINDNLVIPCAIASPLNFNTCQASP